MNTPTPLGADPAHWRQRAKDARRDADLATDPIDRDTLIGIANAYEKLAVIAEAKLASSREQYRLSSAALLQRRNCRGEKSDVRRQQGPRFIAAACATNRSLRSSARSARSR
jgi:hypothetical protein